MAENKSLRGAKVVQGGPKYLQGGQRPSCPPTSRAYDIVTAFPKNYAFLSLFGPKFLLKRFLNDYKVC